MSKLVKNNKEFDEMLRENNEVLVLFYASWCPFSQRFLPVFEKMANDKTYKCCRVLADEMDGCEDKYSIDVFPTVIYFENGKVVKRLDGLHGYGIEEKQFVKMADSCGIIKDKK
ncbi:MAG TPA: protein disulfide isomerase family protein [Smithella sp.]|nr:protein disulfide isomerase family protein [Smithella sp.]